MTAVAFGDLPVQQWDDDSEEHQTSPSLHTREYRYVVELKVILSNCSFFVNSLCLTIYISSIFHYFFLLLYYKKCVLWFLAVDQTNNRRSTACLVYYKVILFSPIHGYG